MRKYILICLVLFISLLNAVYLHEGWDSGRFWSNGWTLESNSSNWQILNIGGAELRFAGYPQLENYDSSLTSREFDISGVTGLFLDFKVSGILIEPSDTEILSVEYRVNGGGWNLLSQLNPMVGDVGSPLSEYSFNLDNCLGSNTLQFRFRVYGADSSDLIFWRFDDIILRDQNYQIPATITGLVTDADLQPLVQALVSDGTNYARTDYSGNYQLSVQAVQTCSLNVEAFGYDPAVATITGINSDTAYNQNFVLSPETPLMDPYRLNASVHNGPDAPYVNIGWNRVNETPMDCAVELGYDDPPAESFYNPYMINECEYLVVRFENAWQMNVGAIKIALKSMSATQVEIVGFFEQNGQPDLNSPIFDEAQVFTYIPDVAGYPEWVQFPLWLDIAPATPFYAGVKFLPQNMHSVGMADTDDTQTYYSFDSENIWEEATGEAAMIRILGEEWEPWDERSFIGYNLYRDHQLLNPNPLPDTYFNDQNPPWGEHLYYATALYSDGESNITNAVRVNVAALRIPYVVYMDPEDDAPYVSLLINAYHINGGLAQLNLKRNSMIVNTYTDFPAGENLFTAVYHDLLCENDQEVQYQLEALYEDGSSASSEIHVYRLFLPPGDISAAGTPAGVQLSWTPPPGRDLVSYRIERMHQDESEIIIDLPPVPEYTDTDVVHGEIYSYRVAAVYEQGIAWSMQYDVVAGPPVLHPPTDLSGTIDPVNVKLSWNRPNDGKIILGKDSPGTSQPYIPDALFSAGISFFAGELIPAMDKEFVELAFFPVSDVPYTIKIYNTTEPEEYMVNEIVVSDPVPHEWNKITSWGIQVYVPYASYRFEISSEGGLMLDDASEGADGANMINLDGTWSDLQNACGIAQNWKFRLKFSEPSVIIPVGRGLYPDLTAYHVVRNNSLIGVISEYDQYFCDPWSNSSNLSYYILAEYDMGISEPSNTIVLVPSGNDDPITQPTLNLNQNYPNPFNPTTTISFSMPKSSTLKLMIYNVKGQLVKCLFDGSLPAGEHSVVWNGLDDNNRAVAGGIYYLRLQSEDGTKTRKMVMQK
ncbi:MAG: FlgD immunoglobulin-like domain containing protein [Candidatus Syntrophosphaera sp.]